MPPNPPMLPSLDQTLLDIRVPGRVQSPTAGVGLQNFAPSSVDPLVGIRQRSAQNVEDILRLSAPPQRPTAPAEAPLERQLGYSPSTGKIGVNGYVFDKNDFANALESEKFYQGAPQPLPRDQINDWVPMSENAYSALLKTIKEPGIGDLFMRNVDIGFAGSQQLLGSGLQLVGAEKLGSDIAGGAQQRLDQLSPFQREFTSIQDAGDVGEFLIATFGQFTPSVLEAVVTGGVGSIAGKTIAKQLVSKEAKKQFAEDVAKYQAAKKAKDTATMKALGPAVREKAGYYGALVANGLNSYRIGASDVYNELRQQGVDPNDVDAKMAALAYGLPYGALEALPEFFAFNKILNPKYAATTPSLARRVASGTAIGGLGGGATEAGQEAILMAAGEQVAGADYSEEYAKRLVNSFAAGAAFGGPVGGAINALAPVNLLKTPPAEPSPPAAPADTTTPYPRPPGSPPDLSPPPNFPRPTGAPRESGMGFTGVPDVSLAPAAPAFEPVAPVAPSTAAPVNDNIPAGLTPPFTPAPIPAGAGFVPGVQEDVGAEFFAPETTGLSAPQTVPPPAPPVLNIPEGMAPQVPAFTGAEFSVSPPPPPPPPKQTRTQKALDKAATLVARVDAGDPLPNKQQLRDLAVNLKIKGIPSNAKKETLYAAIKNRVAPVLRQGELFEGTDLGMAPGQLELFPGADLGTAPAPVGPTQLDLFTKRARKTRDRKTTKPTPPSEDYTSQGELDLGPPVAPETATPYRPVEPWQAYRGGARVETYSVEGIKADRPHAIDFGYGIYITSDMAAAKKYADKSKGVVNNLTILAPKYTLLDQDATIYEQHPFIREALIKAGLYYGNESKTGKQLYDELVKKYKPTGKGIRLERTADIPAYKAATADLEAVGIRGMQYMAAYVEAGKKTENYILFDGADVTNTPPPTDGGPTKGEGLKKPKAEAAAKAAPKGEALKTPKAEAAAPAAPVVEETVSAVEEPSTAPVAGAEQPAAAGATAGRGRAAEPAGKGTAKEGPAKDKGVSKKPTVREIKTVEQAQAVFSELAGNSTTLNEAQEFATAARLLIETTFLYGEDIKGKNKEVRRAVFEQIQSANLNSNQREVFNETFVKGLTAAPTKSIYATVKGVERPWYTYAKTYGLLAEIGRGKKIVGLPAYDKVKGVNTEASAVQPADPKPAPSTDSLADRMGFTTGDVIKSLNAAMLAAGKKDMELFRGHIEDAELAYTATGIDKNAVYLNTTLGSFFKTNGKVQQVLLQTKYNESTNITPAKFIRTDGSPVNAPLDHLKAKATVTKIVNGFKVKPKVHVYINIQNLKLSNPELYERARRARSAPEEFESGNFKGYAFGDDVIILTSKIVTLDDLKATVAHETLGHFGLRSIFSDADLTTLLTEVLATDRKLRNKAREKVTLYKMDETEAAEEALSDLAAELENNTLSKVWNAIKGALNKIGIKFGDEMARYLIRLAGRYVKKGEEAPVTVFNVATIRANMRDLATEGVIGRFSAIRIPSGLDAAIVGGVDIQKDLMADRRVLSKLPRNLRSGVSTAREIWRNVSKVTSKVLEVIQTLDSISDLSEGIRKLYDLFQEQSAFTQRLIQKYMEIQKFTLTPGYASTEERLQAGKMAAFYTLYRQNRIRGDEAKKINDIGALGSIEAGYFTFNEANLNEAIDLAKPDIEMFKKGFDVSTTEEAVAAGIEPVKLNFEAMPELTDQSKEWVIFKELVAVEQEKAKDLLQAKYDRYLELGKEMDRKIARIQADKDIGKREKDFFYNIREKYMEIIHLSADKDGNVVRLDMPTSTTIKNGQEFVVEVLKALHSPAKLNDWKVGTEGEVAAKYYKDPAYKNIVSELDHMNGLGITKAHQIKFILPLFNELAITNRQIILAEDKAKRTIGMAYVPLMRRGNWQVRIEAYDPETDKAYKPGDGIKTLLPSYIAANEAEANEIAARLRGFEVDEAGVKRVFDVPSGDPMIEGVAAPPSRNLSFRVVTSEKGKLAPLGHAIDYDDFIRTILRLDIQLTPKEQESLMQALTGQEDASRRSMLRSGTVGWNPDVVQSVHEDVQTGAHVASKERYSYRTDEIMSDNDNWYGSEEHLKNLKDEFEAAQASGNEAFARVAKQRYTEYAYRFVHMAGRRPNSPNIVMIDGQKVETKGQGDRYRDEGKRLLGFYSQSSNIIDMTEGFLTEQAAPLKNLAVLLQLGGNLSSALVNFVTIPFNVIPYLATYNSSRGYGGGFGFAAATQELSKAMGQTKSFAFNSAESLRAMIDNNEYTKYGLTFDEAVFLLGQTEEGNLQPALTNTLLQSARGGIKSNIQAVAEKGWMSMFTYTEQLTRRTTALAAYRLYRQRAIASGIPDGEFTTKNEISLRNSLAYQDVYRESGKSVVKTNGDYNLYNRPELFRNHFLQYIFMYKMIAVTTMQMVAALPMKGKIYYLGAVLLLAGALGLPFAEDLFDIIDTLAQFFGIPMGSIEAAMTETLNDISGGNGAVAMTGVLNLFGLNVASKIGMGDLVPLTGVFRQGADPGREMMQLAGPVFSAMHGTLDTSFQLAHWGVASTGLIDKTRTLPEIMRNAPSSAVKGFADGLTYLNDGRITDAKGKVVSEDVSTEVIIGRMLGFYPAEAANSNRTIRLGTYTADYAKAISGNYKSAYVQAYVRKDFARMREIANDVKEWNKNAKGTPFFIKDFEERARKAGKEASIPAAARYLKVAPEGSRETIDDLINIYGLEDGTG